ncbi:UNVERIFIED_CONTAM: hypothetical protein O8I53_08035 [Campylobacter lari]
MQNPILSANIKQEKLVSAIDSLFNAFEKSNDKFNLINEISEPIINKLVTTSFDQIDFKKEFLDSLTNLKNSFELQNHEQTIVDLVKIIASTNIREYKQTFAILMSNALKIANLKVGLADLVADKIYTEKNSEKITKFINRSSFISAFNKTITSVEFERFINELGKLVISITEDDAKQINSFKDLLKVLTKDLTKTSLFDNISPLINKVLSLSETKLLVNNILNNLYPDLIPLLDYDKLTELVIFSLNNQSFKYILNDFIHNGLLNDSLELDNISDFNLLIKK